MKRKIKESKNMKKNLKCVKILIKRTFLNMICKPWILNKIILIKFKFSSLYNKHLYQVIKIISKKLKRNSLNIIFKISHKILEIHSHLLIKTNSRIYNHPKDNKLQVNSRHNVQWIISIKIPNKLNSLSRIFLLIKLIILINNNFKSKCNNPFSILIKYKHNHLTLLSSNNCNRNR